MKKQDFCSTDCPHSEKVIILDTNFKRYIEEQRKDHQYLKDLIVEMKNLVLKHEEKFIQQDTTIAVLKWLAGAGLLAGTVNIADVLKIL